MADAELKNVRIADLDRTHNVRRSLGDLADLAASISDVGVLTPVTVTPKADGEGWYLVAGHRRVAAAEGAGLETVPALVHTAGTTAERLLAMLVENLQRLDLDPVEEAVGYGRLVDAGWSQAEVGRRVRRSRGHVSKRLRILGLPDEVQAMVSAGEVTVEHAYFLSRLADKGVDAEAVTATAHDPQEYAEMSLREIEIVEQRDHRRAKLERGGVRVILADRWWGTDHREVEHLRLGGDHTAEPCHAVLLTFGDYGQTKVEERVVCTEYSRHLDGGDSPLQCPVSTEATERTRKLQAEQAEREAERARRHSQFTAGPASTIRCCRYPPDARTRTRTGWSPPR